MSHIHPRSLKNLRHTLRITIQPKQVVQRDSNNEFKCRYSKYSYIELYYI